MFDIEVRDTLIEHIPKWIEAKNINKLDEILTDNHPADIAEVLMDLDHDDCLAFFQLTNRSLSSHVFLELDDSMQSNVLESLERTVVGEMVSEMESDDAADVLAEIEDEHKDAILEDIEDAQSDKIESLLEHEEETAGHLMQTEFLVAPEHSTVEDVINGLEEIKDTISHWSDLYVVDDEMKLVGSCPIQQLLFAEKEDPIGMYMDSDVRSLPVSMDQEEVARIFRKYDLLAMPVVDENKVLLGMITVDDVIDVIDEEHQEDSYRLAGVSEGASTYSTFRESIIKRLPWLGVNLLTASLACSIIGFFEGMVSQIAMIAVFLPIVAALGGNAGSQTVTVIVRAIAMGHIKAGRIVRVVIKELGTGLINGFVIGIVGGIAAFFILSSQYYLVISMVFVLSLWANITVATLLGTVIPIVLKKINLDPAYSSIIFLTLFTDGVGFFVFLMLVQTLIPLFI